MADGDNLSGAGEGSQDICTFFASFLNQRQQMERLLNWLRNSQTVCTDTNCFNDISGMPGTEQGASLLEADDSFHSDEQDPFTLVLCLVIGLLAVYTMGLERNRQREKKFLVKSNISGNGGPPFSDDDHSQFRRNGSNDDDNSRPTI